MLLQMLLLCLLRLSLVSAVTLPLSHSHLVTTNIVAPPDDLLSLYKSLSETHVDMTSEKENNIRREKTIEIVNRISLPESEGLRLVGSVLAVLWDTAYQVRPALLLAHHCLPDPVFLARDSSTASCRRWRGCGAPCRRGRPARAWPWNCWIG